MPASIVASAREPSPLADRTQEITTAAGAKLKVQFYRQLYARHPVAQGLGKHQLCALANARTVHHTQACGCDLQLEGTPGTWILRLTADASVNGYCTCQALCVD